MERKIWEKKEFGREVLGVVFLDWHSSGGDSWRRQMYIPALRKP